MKYFSGGGFKKPLKAEGNPNTGVSATAAPLLAAGVLTCAALAYAGKKH